MEMRKGAVRLSATNGLAGGAVAGLVMSGWKMGTDVVRGRGLWGAPELIATIPLGPSAYDGGHRFRLGPVSAGLVLHEATSAGMGLVYVPLARHPVLGRRPVVTAVGYALASWAAYQYGIMPWLAPVMDRHVSPVGLAIAHVVFGLALGGYAVQLAAGRPAASGAGRVNEDV